MSQQVVFGTAQPGFWQPLSLGHASFPKFNRLVWLIGGEKKCQYHKYIYIQMYTVYIYIYKYCVYM